MNSRFPLQHKRGVRRDGDFPEPRQGVLRRIRYWLNPGLALLLGCLGTTAAFSQSGGFLPSVSGIPVNRDFHVTHWNSKHGLPQNLVRAVLQTRDGYLWLGTQFGLARFDGNRFTVFDRYHTPGITNDAVTCLAEDPSGVLWIGTDAGLLKYEQGQFTAATPGGALPGRVVRSIYPAGNGAIWLTVDTAFVRIQGSEVASFSLKEVPRVRRFPFVHEDESGAIWVAGPDRLFRFNEAARHFDEVGLPGCPPQPSLWLFSKTDPKKVWVAAPDGLYESENGKWSYQGKPGGSREVDIALLFEDRTGALWIALHDGEIFRFGAGQMSRLDLPEIQDSAVNAIRDDREGNLWIGSDAGLLRLTPTQVRTFTRRDGLDDNMVWSVSEARDGGVWVSTRQGLNRLRDDVVVAYTIDRELGNSTAIRAVLEDSSGKVWLGRSGARLPPHSPVLRFQDGRFSEFKLGYPTNNWCRALFLDSSDRLWLATEDGVVCWHEGILRSYSRGDDSFYADVRAILVTRDGAVWLGSYGAGLRQIKDDRVKTYRTANGLSNDHAWAIHEDLDGVLWVGTEYGLNRLQNERFFAFSREHGLQENVINQILEDDFGNLWLSGLRGIYRIRRQDLNDVAEGRTNTCHVVAFGEAEGIENAETNGESQPAGCKTRDGRLWFPTQRGVVAINPKLSRDNRVPPPVIIEQVLADDEMILRQGLPVSKSAVDRDGGASRERIPHAPAEPALRLGPGRAHLVEIRYTANALTAPERVRFKYRLEGYDDEWHDAGDRRVAIYTNLRPREYRFQVIACNSHGYWNHTGAAFRFELAPHFYETWPFYVLCGGVAAAAIMAVLAIRLRFQHKFLKLEQEAELERVRARIAEDIHDDIGASLSQIAILSEVARGDLLDPRRAEPNVERISGIARQLVDSLSELVWATNPRNDTLDNMAAYFREYAANYFESTPIRCQLDFPPRLVHGTIPPEMRRALFLILKEALHNVLKHSGASEASVSLRFEPHHHRKSFAIEMRVVDNGRGLPAEGGRRFGNGLRNMNRRAESVKGRLEFDSSPGTGTRLRVSVPVRSEAN
jgi:ligand-binding sensor domain-containing protein/signal transduction histidine kinase